MAASRETEEELRAALAGHYALEREIGRGGMSTVFLAEDLKHRRSVAIKVLSPDLAEALGVERFLREIETAANLNHPHILPVHDSGEAEGFLFFVMPYVEAESLRELLDREGPLPIPEARRIAASVALALDHAHRRGVIHRDVKPSNILLQDGEPLLADFGIAFAQDPSGGPRLTHAGLVLGTPGYMSPEQVSGEHDVDGRTDVYSLGCVLYEMLTGELPFGGDSGQAILAKHLVEPAPNVRSSRPDVPAELEVAIARAMGKTPAHRFETAAAFADSLDPQRRARPMKPGREGPGRKDPSVSRFCPNCDAALHPTAKRCMYCGADQRPWYRRPWFIGITAASGAGLLALALGLALFGPLRDPVPVEFSVEDFQGHLNPPPTGSPIIHIRAASSEGMVDSLSYLPLLQDGPAHAFLDSMDAAGLLPRIPVGIRRICIRNNAPVRSDSLVLAVDVPGWLVAATVADTISRSRATRPEAEGNREGPGHWEWRGEGVPGNSGIDVFLAWIPRITDPAGLLDRVEPTLALHVLDQTVILEDETRVNLGVGAGAVGIRESGDEEGCARYSTPWMKVFPLSGMPRDSVTRIKGGLAGLAGSGTEYTEFQGEGTLSEFVLIGSGCDSSFPEDETEAFRLRMDLRLSEPLGNLEAEGAACRRADPIVLLWSEMAWIGGFADTLHVIEGGYVYGIPEYDYGIHEWITAGTGRFLGLRGYVFGRYKGIEDALGDFEGVVWQAEEGEGN
jgi:hypothetical protein